MRTDSIERRLRQQRLLLAGLLGMVALALVLLWRLQSSGSRGRTPTTAALAVPQDTPPGPDAPPPVAAVQRAPDDLAREVLAGTATDGLHASAVDAESFEPDALYGHVRVAGRPAADVTVLVFVGELGTRDPQRPLGQTTSDAEGRFRLRGLEPHQVHTLLAQAPAVLPFRQSAFPGEPLELELEPALAVSGHVRARADGRPLAGIELSFARRHWDGAALAERVRTTSDAEGAFQLPWAELGLQTFVVTRPGALPERREFQVRAEAHDDFTILLDETAWLELLVYDLTSGEPLRTTELSGPDGNVRSDELGRVRVPATPEVVRDGNLRVQLGFPGDVQTELRVRPGAPGAAPTRVPIAHGNVVRGRVLALDDRPLAEATVRLVGGSRSAPNLGLPPGCTLNPPRQVVRSDAQGRFELTGCVPREGDVRVLASHPLHPPGRSGLFPFAELGLTQEVEIRLEVGATLAGRVTLDGAPVALTVHWEGEERADQVRSNARGEFEIRGLAGGTYVLRPRRAGEPRREEAPGDLEVTLLPGESATCELVLQGSGSILSGRVLDETGQPVPGAEVYAYSVLYDDELETPEVESDHEGAFTLTLPGVSGRLFTVRASKGPREVERADLAPGTQGLELVLPPLAPLALRVLDAARRTPIDGYMLYWRASEGGELRRYDEEGARLSAGPDGLYRAELPAGRLDLLVSARSQGYLAAWQEEIEVAPERTTELEFRLDLGVELELVLDVPPELRNQLRRTYFLSREQKALAARGGDYFAQEIRGPQGLREGGTLRYLGLPPGEYALERLPGQLEATPATFELPAVGQQRVELRIRPRANGKPGPDAR